MEQVMRYNKETSRRLKEKQKTLGGEEGKVLTKSYTYLNKVNKR